MLKKSVALLTICSLLAMSMVLALKPAYSAGAEIFVDPASTPAAVVGHDYTVYIKVQGVSDLYGWEFQLNYDKNMLDLTYADLATGGLNTPTNTFMSTTDEATGHLWWAVSSIHPATGINHTTAAAIFEIHFHTLTAGTSLLTLSGTILSDSSGNAYSPLTTTSGSIDVHNLDLTVTNITIDDLGCQLYKNDIDNDGNSYYYPVEVTVHNTGDLDAGPFHVKLEVYYKTGSSLEAQQELAVVGGLAAGADVVVNFTALFHPMNTKYYKLTATADSQNEVVEDNEANNQLVQDDIPVTVYGDINGDHIVNILDGVVISKAWDAIRGTDLWYDIKADLSHNGVVNILDATRASLHWGETW